MRYINIKLLEMEDEEWPPEEWKKRARKAEQALRNPPADQTRAKIFETYSDLWGSLKERFRQLSYEKCWYCEAKTDRMRGDIDHFRPKGKVIEADSKHPGYWWLAFDWRNFRFVCSVCNSGSPDPTSTEKGGKGNHFPLVGGESRRVCIECVYEDHRYEYPMLLDPARADDPSLITFTSDGRPRPASKDKIEYLRAKESIKIYQLDHIRSIRKRKREIFIPIRDLIEEIQRDKLELVKDSSNDILRAKIENNLQKLREMIAPQAEYSSAANAYLRRYRRWAWVDRLSSGSK
jgi:uncharacterized protein (TIGR02646 family)